LIAGALLALAAVPSAALAEEPTRTFQGPPVVIEHKVAPKPVCAPLKPIAPEQARVMDITGTVLVEYTVFADGRVGDINVDEASHPALARAVTDWLGGCAFAPGVKRGHTVALRVIQPYVFKKA
jgi:TonB family protein